MSCSVTVSHICYVCHSGRPFREAGCPTVRDGPARQLTPSDGGCGGAGHCSARTGGRTSRCKGPGAWPALDHGRGDGAGVRGDCADAGGPGGGAKRHAALDRGDDAPPGASQRGTKGSGQDGSFVQGPGGRRAGLRRDGQDNDAQSASDAGGGPRVPGGGSCAFSLCGAHPGAGIGDRIGDAATVARPPCGHRRGPGHGDGASEPARAVLEDRPGGRRKLAGIERTDAETAPCRDDTAGPSSGVGGGREATRGGGSGYRSSS